MAKADDLPLIAELRAAVRDSGLSLSELGRQSGVSQQQLSRFMSGKTLTLVTAAKLFDHLGLKVVRSEPAPVDAPPPAPDLPAGGSSKRK